MGTLVSGSRFQWGVGGKEGVVAEKNTEDH